MKTLYLKRINGNVFAYSDKECTMQKCTWGDTSVKPNKRRKKVVVNGWVYNVNWV
mgnify:FL=1